MRWALSHLKPARLRTYSFWATTCPGFAQTVFTACENITLNATFSGGLEATAP